MSFISATIGRVIPRYRTFSQWVQVYEEIVDTRAITSKTRANRRNSLHYLVDQLGERSIGSIKPHEIAQITRRIYQDHPSTARRVLIEAREVFSEAVVYGWIHSNPAAVIKHQPIKVSRRRLSLESWQKIYIYAKQKMPEWVQHMLLLALVTGQRRSDLQSMQFNQAHDGYLHIIQQKTGTRLRLPLCLKLAPVGMTIGDAIDDCRSYGVTGPYLLRKSTGSPPVAASLSARFEDSREGALGPHSDVGSPPSLHECRSLAERLYRKQGVDTRTLLGHKHQSMTDAYNDDRGLTADEWKTLEI